MRRLRIATLAIPTLCFFAACGDDTGGPSAPVGGNDAGAGGEGGERAGAGGGGSGGKSAGSGGANDAGSGTDGGANDGGQGGVDEGGAGPAADCSLVAKPPAEFDILAGFSKSEDFAFDALGNYVGVDDDGNLVRIDKSGKKELWATGLPTTAGIQMLPDGSAVIADVTNGAVVRVYVNGARKVILGGLLYPNGLDIGPDGFVYVSENGAGRVRRVDPDTGDFSIVALGLFGPNGVAFGDDPKLMYIGSFEGSGVYKVVLGKPGELGVASVLARPHGSTLAEPQLACPDQKEGKTCQTTMSGETGKCERLANVIDCITTNSCAGAPEGTKCEIDGTPGECMGGICFGTDVCDGKPDGTSCPGGTCYEGFCQPPDPCSGLAAGDACTIDGAAGTCQDFGGGLWCELTDPCKGKPDGQQCHPLFDPATDGTCHDQTCVPSDCGADCVTSCTEADKGKTCFVDGLLGVCTEDNICQPTDGGGDGPGGIDGLGVDACGNVYASEFTHGIVWRISPAGDIERLADLPSAWVPNIKWGRGLGGFERDRMFVADRDEGRLFSIAVGVPGAHEYYDGAKP